MTVTQNKEKDRTRLEMQIVSLEPNDISNYTCSAYNEAGNDTKNTSLNVLCEYFWWTPVFQELNSTDLDTYK